MCWGCPGLKRPLVPEGDGGKGEWPWPLGTRPGLYTHSHLYTCNSHLQLSVASGHSFAHLVTHRHTTARPNGSHRYTSTVGATGNIWFRVHVRSHYRHLSTGIQSPRWPGHCYKHLATSATDICSQVCSPPHTELGPGTPTRAPYVQPRPMTVVSSDTHPRHVRDPPV